MLFFGTYVLMSMFIFPYKHHFNRVMLINLLFVLTNFFFIYVSFKNPGNVVKSKDVNFDKLVEKMEAVNLCPTCET